MNRPFFLALVLLSLTGAGCDYKLVGTGSSLPPGIKTIHLPTMENRTAEPNLGIQLTQSLTNQLVQDGRLKVTGAGADAKLQGTIVSYALRPLSYDASNSVTAYQVSLAVEVVLTEQATDKRLLAQRVTDTSLYDVTGSVIGSEGARDAAVVVAAQRMAERIVSTVLEGF